ncbi:PH domain-containing protein [Candidatus Woesearchaeota archaeon]|nr:PH domain-containing protein [Candidatus Woesearchaeota archaeon]
MWDIKPHIQKEEKIKYEGTPEWIGYFWGFFFAIITIWTFFIPLLIIMFIVLNKLSTKFVITNKRVAGRFGVISEDFKSVSFKHITSVRVRKGLIGKIFNFGNIIIDTAGSGIGVDFVWRYVKNPIEVKNQIEKRID